jgi:subfamily B ATP-binding cassette protein MsbA
VSDQATTTRGIDTYRRLLRYARGYWKVFIVAAVAMVVYSATLASFAKLMEPLMDESFVNRDPFWLRWTPVLMIVIFVVRAVAAVVSKFGMAWIGRNIIMTLRAEMFDRLVSLPSGYYDRSSSGEIIAKFTYDAEQVAQAATSAVTVLIRDSTTVIALLIFMLYSSFALTVTLILITPLLAILVLWVGRRFREISRRIQRSVGQVSHVVEEATEGNRVVKIFGGQTYEKENFHRINERNLRLHMKMTMTQAASSPILEMIVGLAFAGIIAVASSNVVLEHITVGAFVAFMVAMMMLFGPLRSLANVNATIQRGIAAGESVFVMLDTEPEKDLGTLGLARAEGRVEFRHVSFVYEAAKGKVLEDIDLAIAPGETVALVGRSGSGKSTLVNLLARFYEPTEGEIRVDGVDIQDYRLVDLRDQIAYVGQDVTLFNDTIGRNIAYGRLESATPDDIEQAAQAANALEFIRDLPDGFETLVGENGVLLSGGQRQRVAIARALLKDAPILILDEATSALDTESERQIQDALDHLIRNRTTLVIAHRLSTVEKANRIVVLHKGRIVESGSHDELLACNGRYANLYRMQFRDPDAEIA